MLPLPSWSATDHELLVDQANEPELDV